MTSLSAHPVLAVKPAFCLLGLGPERLSRAGAGAADQCPHLRRQETVYVSLQRTWRWRRASWPPVLSPCSCGSCPLTWLLSPGKAGQDFICVNKQDAFKEPRNGGILHSPIKPGRCRVWRFGRPSPAHCSSPAAPSSALPARITAASWPSVERAGHMRVSSACACPREGTSPGSCVPSSCPLEDLACPLGEITAPSPFLTFFSDT